MRTVTTAEWDRFIAPESGSADGNAMPYEEQESPMTVQGTMAPEELSAITVQKVIDARGTSCPGPILAAKKGIITVAVGDLIEVRATTRAR